MCLIVFAQYYNTVLLVPGQHDCLFNWNKFHHISGETNGAQSEKYFYDSSLDYCFDSGTPVYIDGMM